MYVTTKYKGWFIHESYPHPLNSLKQPKFEVQSPQGGKPISVTSCHAAKCLISRLIGRVS